jgi:hypothetical protein
LLLLFSLNSNMLVLLAFPFCSSGVLSLAGNRLTGTIPNQIGSLTQLRESSVPWLLVVMSLVLCFHCALMLGLLAFHFHSSVWLSLRDNSLMGTIPNQIGSLTNLCRSCIVWSLVVTTPFVF